MDTFYTSDGCEYIGMTQDLVTSLRSGLGLATTFVDKATYDAYLASIPVLK